MTWTSDQILALAPDPESVKAARSLLVPRKWPNMGANEEGIWGECQGSGKDPYRTSIDLSEPAFKCSCPSRKFPCKHGLALFLMYCDQRTLFKSNTPPNWMSEWLKTRTEKKQKKEEKAQQIQQPVDEATQAKREKKREKTMKQREETVQRGIKELELWLRDLTRRGLVNLQSQSTSFWTNVEKRMVDAQAPGLANFIQELESAIVLKENWSNSFLTRLGKLHLLLESYSRAEQFPAEQQADIRTMIGWTQTKEEILQNHGIHDQWQILGQYKEEDEKLMSQRIWLFGKKTKRFALILNFAFGAAKRMIDRSWITGSELDGELVFYPGSTPLRALSKTMGTPTPFKEILGHTSIREALNLFKKNLHKNPWINAFPMILQSVTPQHHQNKWLLVDAQQEAISFHSEFIRLWDLIAISGGEAVTLFGEWRFDSFWPLGIWSNQQYWELASERALV